MKKKFQAKTEKANQVVLTSFAELETQVAPIDVSISDDVLTKLFDPFQTKIVQAREIQDLENTIRDAFTSVKKAEQRKDEIGKILKNEIYPFLDPLERKVTDMIVATRNKAYEARSEQMKALIGLPEEVAVKAAIWEAATKAVWAAAPEMVEQINELKDRRDNLIKEKAELNELSTEQFAFIDGAKKDVSALRERYGIPKPEKKGGDFKSKFPQKSAAAKAVAQPIRSSQGVDHE